MVALGGPSSTTCGQIWAMKRPSLTFLRWWRVRVVRPVSLLDGAAYRVNQRARVRQKRQAPHRPGKVVVHAMPVQHLDQTALQRLWRGLGGEAKVEVHHHRTRNDVAGAGAAVDVADLPTGRLEKRIAVRPSTMPVSSARAGATMWIGFLARCGYAICPCTPRTVSLPLMRAAAAVLDHVAGALHRGGLAHNAEVHRLPTFCSARHTTTVPSIGGPSSSLVKRKPTPSWHCGCAAKKSRVATTKAASEVFMSTGAAAVAGGHRGGWEQTEGMPLVWRTGGHHIGVTGKDQGGSPRTTWCAAPTGCAPGNRPGHSRWFRRQNPRAPGAGRSASGQPPSSGVTEEQGYQLLGQGKGVRHQRFTSKVISVKATSGSSTWARTAWRLGRSRFADATSGWWASRRGPGPLCAPPRPLG